MAGENAPATKKDLRELQERLKAELEERLKASEERLSEQMRDMQTELLKAFCTP